MEIGKTAVETQSAAESPFTLEGRTAIVTGAGRGIGRAIAKRLVERGCPRHDQ